LRKKDGVFPLETAINKGAITLKKHHFSRWDKIGELYQLYKFGISLLVDIRQVN